MSDGSGGGGNPSNRDKALHACVSCRKQKKGCDKTLPACTACVRLKRNCIYGPGLAPAPSEDYGALQMRLSFLEKEMNEHRVVCENSSSPQSVPSISFAGPNASQSRTSTFPSAFFLDVEVYQERGMKAPNPNLAVPNHILRAIGDDIEIQTTIGAYFFSISTWMGMVCKKKLYQEVPSSSIALEADVALLVLCMKLVNDKLPADGDAKTGLYSMAKDFYRAVESSGIASIRLIQANILIALYETGHAIYPEAYLTVGLCGRVGQAIGLHDTAAIPQLGLEPQTWDDMEERRRVWWAVYILDRHMNIGNPTRTLALPIDPQRDTYLPVDDRAWEHGEAVANEPLYLSSATNIAAAPFARLSQASHLLSLVLSLNNDRDCSPALRLEEATQLSRALQALCSFLRGEASKEATRICGSMAICFSALFILYECCSRVGHQDSWNELAEKELQVLAATGLDALVPEVITFATHIQMILPYNTVQASPLISNCLYRMAVHLSRKPSLEYPQAFDFVKQTLNKLGARWRVAVGYVGLLK